MSDYQALALAFRTFFEQTAETTARQTKFVLRRSKLTGAVFVQTLVLGWSEQPEASLNDLAEMAADLGVAITAQGLDERINSAAVTLLETLCQESLRWFQQRVPLDIAVLRQFTAVEILDSSCIALPATLKETYPGSGGDGPAACLKVQLLLNFLTGDLEQIVFQTGCDPDQAYEADLALLRPGVLRLSDLGYFKLDRLKAIADRQAYFLTRLDLRPPCGMPPRLSRSTCSLGCKASKRFSANAVPGRGQPTPAVSPDCRAAAARNGGPAPPTGPRRRPAQGPHGQRPPSGLAGLECIHQQRARHDAQRPTGGPTVSGAVAGGVGLQTLEKRVRLGSGRRLPARTCAV